MKRGEIIDRLASTPEERLLAAKLFDKAAQAERTYVTASTQFLSPAEREFARKVCAFAGLPVDFEGEERAVAMFPPPSGVPESPVTVLRLSHTSGRQLSHRDFLGALMSIGIKRECVGDINVRPDGADVYVLREVADFIRLNLEKAGAARLTVEEIGKDNASAPTEDGAEQRITVNSYRADAVLSAALHIPREESKRLILGGAVMLNHTAFSKPETLLAEGDLLSVRGRGRVRLSELLPETRKGRLAAKVVIQK